MNETSRRQTRFQRLKYVWQGLALVVVAGLSSIVTLIWVWERNENAPLPPLIADMHGTRDEINREFQRRLTLAYPPGTAEQKLIDDIGRRFPGEGFQPRWDWTIDHHAATYARSSFPCRYDWDLTWVIDDQKRITQIDGFASFTCL